ncbi:DUF4040 family protein [Corynebacterium sp. zg254]|uniref:DUF4040 family protein n=1 Tax=Corynebacterium sp. zg254 TaxID=2656645 RepID=UPI00215123C6|nr:DUF4040 family protein [Corynebacterium sp. zg254]MCR5914331.1 DUF4040 family protein [Corynebacterium sp. zg254]
MSLVAIPLVISVALIAVPVLVKLLDRNAGWPLGITFFGVAGYIIMHADPILEGRAATWSVTWIKGLLSGTGGTDATNPTGATADVIFALRMDALSLFFALLALIIGGVVFIYSTRYLHHGHKIMSFYLLMTSFMLAVLLLVLADDVALLFVGWELVSLASFFLIARSGSGGEAGSVRTLLLTFAGGLFLLVGLGLAAITAGTMRVSEIVTYDAWGDHQVRLTLIAVMIALAGFSKAAQIPFHFWLPEAMAADTPVSAFLHAAAVVKAGVYLLIRFSGLFDGLMAWHVLLIVTGMTTAVMAAVYAIQKPDLKKLTAYSTVSQLGWIVATIGVGTPFAIGAAIVHTAAHALFKSSLFMLVGVIDHQAGSRHMHRLGSLWRRMPFTFGSAVIAAASMAAIPPTLGFVSKEGMLEAFLEAPLSNTGIIVLLCAAALGALATMVYSAKYVTGAFIDGSKDMSKVQEAPFSFWFPAAAPGLLSLPAVLFLSRADHPLDSIVTSTGVGETHSHLALWHGVTTPLLISLAVIGVGVVVIWQRHRLVYPLETARLGLFSGAQVLDTYENLSRRLARLLSRPSAGLNPTRHVLWIMLMLIAIGAASVMAPGRIAGLAALEPRVSGIDRLEDVVALAIIAFAVVALIATRSRLASVVLVGIAGVGVSWMMLILGAPDVALTNLLVEFCVVVLMMLVVRHQPRLYLREGENRTRFATFMALTIGLVTFFGVWLLTGRHDKPQVAQWYLENTPKEVDANNVVAAILVEFRAFDTMGELIVLGIAGIVIAAIIQSIPRSPLPGYGPGSTSELFRAEGSTRFPDVHKVPELAPFYSKYLRSNYLNSILSRQVTKYLVPLLIILSAVTFYRGAMAPGGAFLAALVAACGMFVYYLGTARSELMGTNDLGYKFIGWGMFLALGTGLIGFFKGSFLAPFHGSIGPFHWSTSLIFDGGVYLAVLGLIVIVINMMGGRERPGADPSRHADAFRTPTSKQKMGPKSKGKQPTAVEKRSDGLGQPYMGQLMAQTQTGKPDQEAQRLEAQHRAEREAARAPVATADDSAHDRDSAHDGKEKQ